ncbi:hypothetical protein, partial [Ruegeria sp. HKCCD8929]|uniref:hypothetical protein n=1 Tax=Ruegeria sp. HKCCD8929 TaxID=2683006 RepID=UPI001C2BDA3C
SKVENSSSQWPENRGEGHTQQGCKASFDMAGHKAQLINEKLAHMWDLKIPDPSKILCFRKRTTGIRASRPPFEVVHTLENCTASVQLRWSC